MNVFDRFEEAKHDLVLVCGLSVGVSTYCCERCGALVKLQSDKVILFFVPETSLSTEARCLPVAGIGRTGEDKKIREDAGVDATAHVPLRDRLKKLEEEDWERLRRAAED